MIASESATQTGHEHDHVFLGQNHERNERRTWFVIALTSVMMVVEIAAGTIYGSMALVADGWHMSTHAAAMLIAALAYLYARRNAKNPRFTFGTGKVGDLAAFASAIVLALVALLIGWESVVRLANPVPISFPQAIVVAVIGLIVNLVSAWLLREDHDHHHGHSHHHDHSHDEDDHHHHGHHGRDQNLRAAYLHVLADALTSVLAIIALIAGSVYGWIWLDPLMGIVGALVIARWSWGLMRDTGAMMLDYREAGDPIAAKIRSVVEEAGDKITDLHVWQLGPGHHAAIIAVSTASEMNPVAYRERLAQTAGLSHITVEVNAA
ncbi:MAG: CDF family Co(II)/Ni(II) efflux transporter DmeF [Parasphingorhabdus sp.]|jgi:cation diffusion facilitator family transporter|uniref:CDF family Co(II)/Ni(II) efflux transporter DmeF n=1 Tax=Parasphingorhabdus sp. TaxID=2709688 RepID=UPI000C0FB55D|nr:MAG: cation transporter [Sphingopyxis sp.]|tara:strand:- start:102865 stop:103830 length:966 start_codon:yes stop_codon:yes gene_type:complete